MNIIHTHIDEHAYQFRQMIKKMDESRQNRLDFRGVYLQVGKCNICLHSPEKRSYDKT